MILRLTYSCYHHHPPRFPALKTWSCPWFVLCPTLDSFGYQLPLTLTCCEFTHFSASPMSLLSKLLPVVWPGPFNSLPACCPILRTLPSNSSSDWCRISCLSSADNFSMALHYQEQHLQCGSIIFVDLWHLFRKCMKLSLFQLRISMKPDFLIL